MAVFCYLPPMNKPHHMLQAEKNLIKATLRRGDKANRLLEGIGRADCPEGGFPLIAESLALHGFSLSEDRLPQVESGHKVLSISRRGVPVENAGISYSWHLMSSGKYEIVAYLS